MTRYLLLVPALTLVYALALASFHPWDLAIGAALSAVLLVASRRFVFVPASGRAPPLWRRVLASFPFAAEVIRQIIVGTWAVALVTLHLRPLLKPGLVEVPIGDRTEVGVAVWAVVAGLPPGSFFVDLDRERGVALLHLLDARDPDGFRQQQAEFYRRFQSRVFP